MARVRFVADYAGTGEMLRTDYMLAAVMRHAGRIEDIAVAISPLDQGEYVSSFHIIPTTHGGPKGDRAQARVENFSPHANFVEFGTSRQKGRHVLLTAAVAAGSAS
jgi:hypothetical protein